MSLKVAIIIERAEIDLGGAERSMSEVATALSAMGVQVDVLAAKGQAAQSVHVLCPGYPRERVPLPVFASALRRHIARAGYDILHSVLPFTDADLYQPRGGTYAETILRNAASYPNPLVRRWKRMTAFTNIRRLRLLHAERRCCHEPGGPVIAALSGYVVEQFRKHYKTDPQRIVRILNGVDVVSSVDPSVAADSRRQFLARLSVSETQKPVLFLFAAHNFRLKGLCPLIRAMQVVRTMETERPVCLVIAGAGRGHKYRGLARRMGVEDHILFLGAVEDIHATLAASDVGILPTFYDPSSRFILESLAAGKPVITTRFNGAADHFTDGRHGKVIDSPDNISALADAICHFTSTANIQAASQAIAKDDLRSHVSIRRVARDLLQIYQAILAARRPSGQGDR